MMICKNCKTDFNGTFCPKCGQKVENKLFDNLKRFMYDDSENIISVLGNNTAQTFISTGVLGNGFAILSDKRVYFKGKCLIRKGKGFYSKIEEKSVDVKDITGTGFVHNKATWAKVLRIIALVFSIYASVFMTFLLIVGEVPVVELPAAIFSVGIFWGFYLLFSFLYKRYNYSAFEISYAGGGIAFDMHWISEEESHEFQKELNLLKDKVKSSNDTPDISQYGTNIKTKIDFVPEQLKQYKELLDTGVITQEEFDTKKKELLGL